MSHEQECVERVIVAGINTASGGPAVVTSEDGVTWNEVVGFPGASASQVSVAGGAFFIQTAAEYTANNYAYSYDGDYWQLGSADAGAFCVARTDNYFVSLNSNASARSSTPPGPWGTNVGTGSGSGHVGRRLIHRSGRLVGAINFTATQPSIVVSDDEGATWTAVNATPGTGSSGTEPWVLSDMDYGAGRYVATVARPSAFLDRWIITSTNGLTWTTVSTGIPDQFPVAIRYGNGQFVAVGTPNWPFGPEDLHVPRRPQLDDAHPDGPARRRVLPERRAGLLERPLDLRAAARQQHLHLDRRHQLGGHVVPEPRLARRGGRRGVPVAARAGHPRPLLDGHLHPPALLSPRAAMAPWCTARVCSTRSAPTRPRPAGPRWAARSKRSR
jgi:hypothetical protein